MDRRVWWPRGGRRRWPPPAWPAVPGPPRRAPAALPPAPPPGRHHRRGPRSAFVPRWKPLGSLLPGVEVASLLICQLVDAHAHRLQLQPGHLGVDLGWHVVDLRLELRVMFGQVLETERLVGET